MSTRYGRSKRGWLTGRCRQWVRAIVSLAARPAYLQPFGAPPPSPGRHARRGAIASARPHVTVTVCIPLIAERAAGFSLVYIRNCVGLLRLL